VRGGHSFIRLTTAGARRYRTFCPTCIHYRKGKCVVGSYEKWFYGEASPSTRPCSDYVKIEKTIQESSRRGRGEMKSKIVRAFWKARREVKK